MRATAATISCGIVPHVLEIGAPAGAVGHGVRWAEGVDLAGDGQDGGGVDAATVDLDLSEGPGGGARLHDGEGPAAVGLGVGRWGLAGPLGDVVGQAHVAGAEVVRDEHAGRHQRLVEIGGDGTVAEGGPEGLVLQVDDHHVGDGWSGRGGRSRCTRQGKGAEGHRTYRRRLHQCPSHDPPFR